MASTVVSRTLTEAHRLGQLRVRARVLKAVLAAWPLYDLDDPAGTWERFEQVLLAVIGAQAPLSAALSADYYRAFRHAEGIAGTADVVVASTPPADEVIRSLRYVGLVQPQGLIAAKAPDAAARTFTNVAGDTARHVQNAGRDTITGTVDADPRALGWARVTDGNPCSFCRMLAGRGPVYGSQAAAAGKWHNKCGCTAEPTFHADAPWPGQAAEFRQQWDTVTAGLSGKDARLAYRQAVEGRPAVTAG